MGHHGWSVAIDPSRAPAGAGCGSGRGGRHRLTPAAAGGAHCFRPRRAAPTCFRPRRAAPTASGRRATTR